jgi:hypothetical protein
MPPPRNLSLSLGPVPFWHREMSLWVFGGGGGGSLVHKGTQLGQTALSELRQLL